jgi:sulfur-carrier protein adenylyltransferase/sulfurtransferase
MGQSAREVAGMPVRIDLSVFLRSLAGDLTQLEAEGMTVREAVERLASTRPALRPHLPALKSGNHPARILLNDRLLRRPVDLETRLEEGDVLTLVAPPHARMETVSPELTPDEGLRYARHLNLPEVGEEGQRRLKASSVLVIGLGGLGSPLALYLAAAGLGKIGIVDFDTVDPSDLHRQILHGTADLGRSKIESARQRMSDLNPYTEIAGYPVKLTPSNALEIIRDYDVVADATDNFPTRYLLNDACILLGRPNVYGSVFQFEGQATIFGVKGGPCYRCIYPEPPPPGMVRTCVDGGVLGILPGVIGLIQATEVVKLLLGLPHLLVGRSITYDALRMRFRDVTIHPDPTCPACGDNPRIDSLIDYEGFCQLK